jgi:hypothetical protein
VQAGKLRLAPLRVARWVLPAALLVYLVHSLVELGWVQIWQSLPSGWLFYALLLASYFVQPVTDLIVYRHLWKAGAPLGLAVFLRKRFMNGSVFDYAGEGYLFFWAQRNLALSNGTLLHAIKDNNLLSAGAAMVVLSGLLIGLSATGQWRLPLVPDHHIWIYAAIASLPFALCAGLVLARGKVTILTGREIAFTFAMHCSRTIVCHASQVALWSLAMPSVPLAAWLNFLAFRILVSRLSFVGANGLLLVTTGIGFAGALGLPSAGVAGVLLTIAAGEQLLALLVVGVPWLAERTQPLAQTSPAR